MPDPSRIEELQMTFTGQPVDAEDELLSVVAQVVLTTPGVTGLAPTLSTAGLRAVLKRRGTEGIQLVSRGDLVEVDVNVATVGVPSARSVAHQIRDRVSAELASRGTPSCSVTVSVLSIDPTASTAPVPVA